MRQALLVLTNIPFALIGGVVGLWITGEFLSVPASVGFIALLGIVFGIGIGALIGNAMRAVFVEFLPLPEWR